MPFVYNLSSKMLAENFTTNGTANTETDHQFVKPGATRAVMIIAIRVGGKGAGLTALSGIAFRVKTYPTTASAGGTAETPSPVDVRAPAAVATAGMSASAGVTPGTGTATFNTALSCGASGPGGWVAPTPDAALVLDGNQTKSMDLYSSSGTVSLNFEESTDLQE